MRRLLIALAAVAAMAIVGCTASHAGTKMLNPGADADVGKFHITMNGARDSSPGSGGYTGIVDVAFTIHDTAGKPVPYAIYHQFTMHDGAGRAYPAALSDLDQTQGNLDGVPTGASTVHGEVPFELPAAVTGPFTVTFTQPSGSVTWNSPTR